MIVPEYDQKVGVDDIGVPAAHVESMGPGSSGVQIAEAEAGLGNTVEGVGGDMAKYIVWQQRNAARADGYDRINGYALNQDQALNGDGGLLTKQRGNAVGITHGKDLPPGQQGPTDLDPNSYIGQESKWREKALAGLSPGSQEYTEVLRGLDSHRAVGFNAVVKHEAQQAKLSDIDKTDTFIAGNANTFSTDPSSPASQKLLQAAQDARTDLSRRQGEDADTTNARGLAVGDQFAKAMVDRNIELKPDLARDALEKMHSAGQVSEDTYGVLKSKVDGKWLDMRKYQVADQVLNNPANSDAGVANFGRVEAAAKQMVSTLPLPQQEHILDEVHKQAERRNAAFEQNKNLADQKFSNSVLDAQRQGVPPENAYDSLIKKGSFIDNNDRAEKEKLFQAVYTKDPSAMSKIMTTQTPDQKLAWDWVEKVATAKFKSSASEVLPGDEASGVKTNLRGAFVEEMKRQYMGKSPAEIRAGVMDAVKDVVTDPGWMWDTKKPKWQLTRDAHDLDLDKRAKLSSKYGDLMVNTAQAFLEKNNKQARPEDIAALVEQAKKANGVP
jgi:hypothetical protein